VPRGTGAPQGRDLREPTRPSGSTVASSRPIDRPASERRQPVFRLISFDSRNRNGVALRLLVGDDDMRFYGRCQPVIIQIGLQ
jgi:hypothetical protein